MFHRRPIFSSSIIVTVALAVLFLFIPNVSGTELGKNTPPCTLVFCALNGARASCTRPNNTCADDEDCSNGPPLACAIWALGPPALNCTHRCPRKCLHPNHRPVASDGIAYCTDCSFIHASCNAAFSIVGPIARGVKYALRTEAPLLPSVTPEMTAESQKESLSPMVSYDGTGSGSDDNMAGDQSMAPSSSPLVVPDGEGDSYMPLPSIQAYPSMEMEMENSPFVSSDGSEEMSSPEYIVPTSIDDTPLATAETNEMYPDYCLAPRDSSLRVQCCVDHGIGCASPGHACSPPTSPQNQSSSQEMPKPPCGRDVTCVLTTVGRPSSGVCVRRVRAPLCTVQECAKHGPPFVCRLPDSMYVSTCAGWTGRTDGGTLPNCNRTCPTKCQSPRPRASNGSTFCTSCSLIVESCRRHFAIWIRTQSSIFSLFN